MVESSLKSFMNAHPDMTGYDYVHKETQELIIFMNDLIETNPVLTQLLESGTEQDMMNLLNDLSVDYELSPIVIALEKSMVAHLKKREDLQQKISRDIIRWFRRGGWKFPKLSTEHDG